MADALSRYRQAEPSKDALKRYRDAPSGDTLGALAKYLGLQGYWDRQGQIAQDGLQMADEGAKSVRGGNLSGLGGLALGPLNYFASPITALLPTSDETYAAKDIPEWAKPSVAGTLGAMAAVMPGPKGARLGKGMTALADDVTAAERAALAGRLETEAAQSGGQAVATPRDQALRNLTEAPEAISQVWGPKFDVLMGQQYRIAEAGSDYSTMYDILRGKLDKASGIEPGVRVAMEKKVRELYDAMGPDGRRMAGIPEE